MKPYLKDHWMKRLNDSRQNPIGLSQQGFACFASPRFELCDHLSRKRSETKKKSHLYRSIHKLHIWYYYRQLRTRLAKHVWILSFLAFFKTNVAQSVAELILYSQNHEMWSFSIKFGKIRFKNVNNTFIIKRNFT